MPIERLLTSEEAAKYLGVSKAFLERDRWAGARIPFVRVGARAVRYKQSVLEEFADSQTRRSTSDIRFAASRKGGKKMQDDLLTRSQVIDLLGDECFEDEMFPLPKMRGTREYWDKQEITDYAEENDIDIEQEEIE